MFGIGPQHHAWFRGDVQWLSREQRSRRPIFNATLRAAASWLFFRVARSTRMNPDMGALPPVRLGPP